MDNMNKEESRIALLIDCDNASHVSIDGVLKELAKYGVTNIRRAYGNWKSSRLKGWEEELHAQAIMPIQQFDYTKGKNATDAAMIIDAMDILYTRQVDGFALMTSDSDFTPLVMRLLSNGCKVYGFGEKKTPEPFVNACSQFIYTENLVEREENGHNNNEHAGKRYGRSELRAETKLVRLLRTSVEQISDDEGWANLATVGQYISNNSSFSPINYGYKKLSDLVRVSDLFHLEKKEGYGLYIKDKREK